MEIKLINGKSLIKQAYKNKKVIYHVNLNNLEWAKAIIMAAKVTNKPVILGASPAAIKYCGGFKTVFNLYCGLIEDLDAANLVILHLDHGSYEDCIQAIKVGFKSVMYDGSLEDFKTNLANTKRICELAKLNDCCVEAEVGRIGSNSKGEYNFGEATKLNEALEMKNAGIDMLAVGIGNVHGQYPQNWGGLNFDLLAELNETLKMPLVLHGGSGISDVQIRKSISLGITKININTELQIINAINLKDYLDSHNIMENKNFNPRKLYKKANEAMQEYVIKLLNGQD
ncbi:class II fructose-bisphosphate aldolase [Metamycoplasma neophronis]|uniref:Class II fructose-bisphosphate aldolase family protein n=1 Tax=Metamycoplasma neophronis TaxID=872983 RepID=A0ABY2Z167_9BACT|nr:class II fructose-bisphosphate aldolase [Metamycoplasma neophronis]TPR54659.1 class II fructose-bisphosphate aldolase family protein [Metamycoplasma neophronis]